MQTQDLTPDLVHGHQVLAAAVVVAAKHHGAQVRKGTRTPYISHLLQVSGMVLEFGGGLVEAAAGVLHDILEDTGIGFDLLEEEMESNAPGNPLITPVLSLVQDCTDTSEGQAGQEKEPWMVRKTRHLEHLGSVSQQAALVIACDKLHNLRCQVADLEATGQTIKFNAPTSSRVWVHLRTMEIIGHQLPHGLRQALTATQNRWLSLLNL